MKNLADADVEAALARVQGNVTWAAGVLDVKRGELWGYIQRRPELLGWLTDWREEMVDAAESYLREANVAGKSWAITFILNTLGKMSGFDGTRPASADQREPTPPLEEHRDFARLNAEQLAEFQQLQTLADGGADGTATTEPEFIDRLDRVGTSDELGDPSGAGVRKVLAKYAGDVSRAAEKLGVTRAELMEYLTRRPDLHDAAGDVREEIVDHAESELRKAVDDKRPWAIRFVLKTLGASRGYSSVKAHDRRAPHPAIPPQSRGDGKKGPAPAANCRSEQKTDSNLPPQVRVEVEVGETPPPQTLSAVTKGTGLPSQGRGEVETITPHIPVDCGEGRAMGNVPPDPVRVLDEQNRSRILPRLEGAARGRGVDIPICQTPGGSRCLTHWLPTPESG